MLLPMLGVSSNTWDKPSAQPSQAEGTPGRTRMVHGSRTGAPWQKPTGQPRSLRAPPDRPPGTRPNTPSQQSAAQGTEAGLGPREGSESRDTAGTARSCTAPTAARDGPYPRARSLPGPPEPPGHSAAAYPWACPPRCQRCWSNPPLPRRPPPPHGAPRSRESPRRGLPPRPGQGPAGPALPRPAPGPSPGRTPPAHDSPRQPSPLSPHAVPLSRGRSPEPPTHSHTGDPPAPHRRGRPPAPRRDTHGARAARRALPRT